MRPLTVKELKNEYLDFFRKKGHVVIENHSLVPSKEDPTVLFTTAGMHPLVPYLLGKPHPQGKRLADVQRCVRTGDIDEVGDEAHLTFFEMLGNWSLGDYFKKESIGMSYEFLTEVLEIDPKRISVTCFAGNRDAPKDTEAAEIWKGLGISSDRIFFLPREDNWWGPVGEAGPCGPDTEIFFDTGRKACGKGCKPGCGCGKYFEIWNNVFMGYNKTADGKFVPSKQRNIDTGMGVERTVAILQGKQSVYEIEVLKPIMDKIFGLAKNNHYKKLKELAKYSEGEPEELINFLTEEERKSVYVITDHMRAAVFIIADGVRPANNAQGSVLRRLIRMAIRHARVVDIEHDFTNELAKEVIKIYANEYPNLRKSEEKIFAELSAEYERFAHTLVKGLNVFNRIAESGKKMSGENAFLLFQSYGFPLEMTKELAFLKGVNVDVDGFNKEYARHQELSRKGAEQKFKGGLVDQSEQSARLHTATHLLAQALRDILGKEVMQRGSNITAERLRYDFSFDRKLSDGEIRKAEQIVNQKIAEALPVRFEEMSLEQARKIGAVGVFEHKYGEKVRVYFIGDYSKEICGGPHTSNTSNLGHFRIQKEEASSAGVRRVKAVLDQ